MIRQPLSERDVTIVGDRGHMRSRTIPFAAGPNVTQDARLRVARAAKGELVPGALALDCVGRNAHGNLADR